MPLDISISTKAGDLTVTREYLFKIPLPEKTRTYYPVSHKNLVNEIETSVKKHLPGWDLVGEKYVTSRKDRFAFGKLLFRDNSGVIKTPLMWGWRNGWPNLSLAIATGAGVFVCSNLVVAGEDVSFIRWHTSGVWEATAAAINSRALTARSRLINREKEIKIFKENPISTDDGYRWLGLLYGRNVLKPRMLSKARSHWEDSPFEEFKPRNVWSLYNSATWALGQSRAIGSLMGKHQEVHERALVLVK